MKYVSCRFLLRFQRNFNSLVLIMVFCFQNSTTRVIWAYSNLEPAHPGQALVYHGSEQRGFRSLFLVDGGADVSTAPTPPDLRAWELLHHQTGVSRP